MNSDHETPNLPEVLTPEQIAQYLQLPLETILTILENQELPAIRISNTWRVRRSLLNQWLDEQSQLSSSKRESFRKDENPPKNDLEDPPLIRTDSKKDPKKPDKIADEEPPLEDSQISSIAGDESIGSKQGGSLDKDSGDQIIDNPISESKRYRGFVKNFDLNSGHGHIKSNDGRELSVRALDVENYGRNIRRQDIVEFDIRGTSGQWEAYNVAVIPKTSRRYQPIFKADKGTTGISKGAQIAYERALAARENKDYDRARAQFEEAIKRGASSNVIQAYAAMEEKIKPEKASTVLERGIKLFPEVGVLYNDYAMLKRRLKDLHGALDILRRGLEMSGTLGYARQLHWSLATILIDIGREEDLMEAAEHAQKAKELGQNLQQDWRYIKLQILTGPLIGKLAYQFFTRSGFDVKAHSYNKDWADIVINSSLSEYVETYDLRDRILVRCFYTSVAPTSLTTLQNTIRTPPKTLRDVNQDIAFVVVEDITPLRDFLYRLMSDNREAIVPLEKASLVETNQGEDLSEPLRPILDQWLSRRDLYRFNYPVYGRRFFGRELDLQRLMRELDDGHNVGVFGLRKVGKTSLLMQLRELRPQDIVIYFDLQSVPSDVQDCDYVYWAIARNLYQEIERKGQNINGLNEIRFQLGNRNAPMFQKKTSRKFDHDIRAVLERLDQERLPTRVIVILDEVDRLLPASGFNAGFRGYPDFLAYVRGIAQNSNGQFVTIITAANPALCEEAMWEGRDNPIFQFYNQTFLPPLTYKDCIEMILKLGKGMGISYDEASLELIFHATSGHPYLTRLLCSLISQQNPHRPLQVTREIVNDARSEFLRGEATPIFNEILERLRTFFPVEAELLLFIADGFDSEADLRGLVNQPVDNALYHLLGYHLVERNEGVYTIKIDLLHEWISQYHLGKD